jgi:AcrR family transcriptional regulator
MANMATGRARILDAAVGLVSEGGPGRAAISEVCRRAGVRPPAIYYHYGNKDGLMAAVVETVAAAWLDELEADAALGAGLEERLDSGLRGWRAMIRDPQSAVMLLVRVQLDCAASSPTIGAALTRIMARARSIIATAIEEAAGPLDDADELAQIVVSMVQGAALRHQLEGDDGGLDRRLEEMRKTIRTLVGARRIQSTQEEHP